jgi:hypothetical protein
MPREATVLAPRLVPGDVLLQAGLSGIIGRVVHVSVGPKAVAVTLDDRTTHPLGLLEVCTIERELRAEAR